MTASSESYTAERKARLLVVHWNQAETCVATVSTLLAQQVPLCVTVLDNHSELASFQRLQTELAASIELVRLDENKGWGGALNVVLQRWLNEESSPYCIISAHDAVPAANCLRLLIAAADRDPRIGIACPQYPDPFIVCLSRWRGVYPKASVSGSAGSAQEVPAPHGTLMLVQRACLQEIGLFDERYFAYGDEHELGARAVRRGWKVVLVWGAVVTNPGTGTASALRSYFFARNSLLLVHDYFGRAAATLRAVLLLANTLRLLVSSREDSFAFSARARWKAVRDYFGGRYGRPDL